MEQVFGEEALNYEEELVREMRDRELRDETEFLRDYDGAMEAPISQKEVSSQPQMQSVLESQNKLAQAIYLLNLERDAIVARLSFHTMNHTLPDDRNCTRCEQFNMELKLNESQRHEAEERLVKL